MNRVTMQVARWEFLRYLKPKQQLVGMLLTFVMGLAGIGVAKLADGGDDVREIAVIGNALGLQTTADSTLAFTYYDAAAEDSLRGAVAEGELDALLLLHDTDRATLLLRRRADWSARVRAAVTEARQLVMLAQSGIPPETLMQVLAPPQLDVTYTSGSDRAARGERVAFIVLMTLMLMAVFVGMSYIFTSITGEKQVRVTEQVVSAIPAQAWIDGKIIGLIGVSLVSVANTAVALVAMIALFARSRIALPDTLGDPVTITVILLFTLLGLCFWFAFLGAIAAMIDDPQNSTRGSMLFIPIFATGLAFMIGNDPDTTFARVLSLLPPTAPSAMPVRLLAGDVPILEIVLALALLAAGVWLLRRAAGRIFRLAMLMYGKEPSWAEVRKWVLQGGE